MNLSYVFHLPMQCNLFVFDKLFLIQLDFKITSRHQNGVGNVIILLNDCVCSIILFSGF